MTSATMLAALAAGLAVPGVWALIEALERGLPAGVMVRTLAPLDRAASSGAEPTRVERRRLVLLGAVVLGGAGWLVGGPVVAVALAAATPSALVAAVRRRRSAWRRQLERDAPILARALADAIGAGRSVRGALGAAHRGGSLSEPAATELLAVAHALELGEPTDAVLERLRRRAGTQAYESLAAAILIQRDAGGDLAGLLRGLAAALEEAARARDDARAATAQARTTGLIVAALPLGAALLAELASPGFVAAIAREPLAAMLAAAALSLQVVAALVIRRVAAVER